MILDIVAIEGQNFLTFHQLPKTSVENLGLVFVKGQNMDDAETDSNDSGKSNLFNLITWVLFEKLAKTGKEIIGDDVVNVRAGKDCFGRLWLKQDGKEFTITRYRKYKGKRNTAEIEGAIQMHGKRAASNVEIEKILGMTYSMFISSVFWAQGDAARRLISLTDAEYKLLFDELVGTEEFEKKRKKLSVRTSALSGDIADHQQRISHLEGSIASAEESIKELAHKYDAVDLKKLEEAYEKWSVAEKRTLEKGQQYQATQTKILDTKDRLERAREQYRAKVAQFNRVNSELTRKKCSQCQQDLKTKESIANVEKVKRELSADLNSIKSTGQFLTKELKDYTDKEGKQKRAFEKAKGESSGLWGWVARLIPKDLGKHDPWTVIEIIRAEREQGDSESTKGRIREYKKELLAERKALKLLESYLKDMEMLKRAYGPAGMKSMRMEELNPALNQQAEYYSQELSGGALRIVFNNLSETKKGELRERYSVVVEKDDGVNFKLSGGGMVTRANLIAAFALDDVRKEMTGVEVSLKVYDEPSEGLDASGETAIVNLIREKLIGTSFFVSHKSLLSDNVADAVWTVKREDKISVLV